MNYVKRPVVIQALPFTDDTEQLMKLKNFMDQTIIVDYKDPENPKLLIETLEGTMEASIGDYIIRGIKGEFYPCKPGIFNASYDPLIEN